MLNQDQVKHAFRVAFDMFAKYYPPKDDADYFTEVMNEIDHLTRSDPDNLLVQYLLMGVYEFFNTEAKIQ